MVAAREQSTVDGGTASGGYTAVGEHGEFDGDFFVNSHSSLARNPSDQQRYCSRPSLHV